MIAYNFNSLCKEAEQYFYDFIFDKSQKPVPQYIVEHLNQCQHCSGQINQLKGVLSQVEDGINPEQKQEGLAAAAWLKLHFDYIGKPVNCETVKPFLPGFLEPTLEIKIPTPITVHLYKCKQCQDDLETIRKFNLNSKQLCRLSQLFAAKGNEAEVDCSLSQAAIPMVVTMVFSETNKEILEHLCVCPNCRTMIYQQREAIRNKYMHSKKEPKMFMCREISASDYFDYVVPYGLDPATDQYSKFRSSFTSHSSTCPICLNKMQQLHNTIFGIAERAESGVVTIYHIEKPAKAKAVINPDDIYAGFPINVEIVRPEDKLNFEQPDQPITNTPKKKDSVIKIKPLVKIGLAAAAVILIGSALLLNISTAKAVTLEGIYKTIEKIRNVHISNFDPGKKEPVLQRWVSKTLNVNMIKTNKELVLWDITNKVKKIKLTNSELIETMELSTETAVEIQNTITESLGLMPFQSISEIPNNAQWGRIDDKSQKVTEGIEVYDLIWIKEAFDGSKVFWKWRVFVDAKTTLPQRTEWYQKLSVDDEYILKSVSTVEYLDNREMQEVIKKESF